MKLKIWFTLFFLIFSLSGSLIFSADTESESEMMAKLNPFLGRWKTLSVFPKSGQKAPGILEYRWVLGNTWMFIEFVGNHPKRKVWGAYAFIRYDDKRKQYISYDIFDRSGPILTTGYWLSPETIRFEDRTAKAPWGIDYTIRENGEIYQENWVIKDKQRVVTLKTSYSKLNRNTTDITK